MMKKKLLITILLIACMILSMIPTVSATATVDVDRMGSVTIYYEYEGLPLPGVPFHIWRIASVDEHFKFTPTENFASYDVSWENDAEGWNQLAYTLLSYAERDGIKPDYETVTGDDGYAEKIDLPTGLYLFMGDSLLYNNHTYYTIPTLVMIPTVLDDGTLLYDVTVSPKVGSDPWPGGPTEDVRVLKVWKNTYFTPRPDYVVMQLLRDGVVYDTVILNESNNWRYTWTELDSSYNWTVVEKTVPDGYTVTIAKEGITFVVTNTGKYIAPGPGPGPVEPDTPTPVTPSGPSLPQTGQLWWPVPFLAFIGLMFLAFGLIRRRSEQ